MVRSADRNAACVHPGLRCTQGNVDRSQLLAPTRRERERLHESEMDLSPHFPLGPSTQR